MEVARRDVVSYALYPKVMREYMEHRALHGDTSVLPTPTFFYGLRVGEEAWIDIEPGKTLIVKLLSIGDVEPDGARVLTFEINGQSRQMRVADDAAKVSGPKRRRATAKAGRDRRADAGPGDRPRHQGRRAGQGGAEAAGHRGDEAGDGDQGARSTAWCARSSRARARASRRAICWS